MERPGLVQWLLLSEEIYLKLHHHSIDPLPQILPLNVSELFPLQPDLWLAGLCSTSTNKVLFAHPLFESWTWRIKENMPHISLKYDAIASLCLVVNFCYAQLSWLFWPSNHIWEPTLHDLPMPIVSFALSNQNVFDMLLQIILLPREGDMLWNRRHLKSKMGWSPFWSGSEKR